MHEAAVKARALRILGDALDRKLPMRHALFRRTPFTRSAATVGQSRRPVMQPAKTRTSPGWLATAVGLISRLSCVREGLNGAMIQPSPSSIRPSGAMCGAPSALIVVTMVSTMRGMTELLFGPLGPCPPTAARKGSGSWRSGRQRRAQGGGIERLLKRRDIARAENAPCQVCPIHDNRKNAVDDALARQRGHWWPSAGHGMTSRRQVLLCLSVPRDARRDRRR